MSRHIPEDQHEVRRLVESGEDKKLYDAEDARFKEEVGGRIKDERERNNYTQRDLADTAGLLVGTIVSAEQGCRSLTIDSLIAIVSALKVSAEIVTANGKAIACKMVLSVENRWNLQTNSA